MLDLDRLRAELHACCDEAGLDPGSFVVFVVDGRRPQGTTPMAYLQPAGVVLPDTVLVFRVVGSARAGRHRLGAHRLATWRDLPGIPEAAVGPILRHELEHARRWERSGTRFFEADDLLRASVRRAGGHGYSFLPSELEANAASAAFAARTLAPGALEELRGCDDCEALLAGASPPADVVEATLAELARRDDWSPPGGAGRAAYLDAVRAACAAWDPVAARALVGGRDGPVVELVRPGNAHLGF
jgi:hypothetical protein